MKRLGAALTDAAGVPPIPAWLPPEHDRLVTATDASLRAADIHEWPLRRLQAS